MTSSGYRRPEDPDNSVVGIRFFNVILHGNLRDQKLLIPGRFVRTYGESLSNSATLKVPSGETWTVGVVRDEIGVWFTKGWQELAEFHSLEVGHFLVFEYEGCSRFSLVICDRTGAEIAYAIRTTCEANVEESEENFDPRITKKFKLLMEVSNSQVKKRKMMRGRISAENAAKMGSWLQIVSPADHDGTQVSEAQCASNSSQYEDEEEGESKTVSFEEPSCLRKCKSLTGFVSPHPFFQVQITQSMASKQMHVPRSFSTSHIALDEKAVQLQVRNGSSWSVALIRKKNNKYVMFSGGWDRFAKENLVKPGDVCVFECLRRWTNVLMQVTIVRDV